MGNLSAFIKEETATVSAIYAYWKKRGEAEQSRGYLGASSIGHECDRYLWMSFRWCGSGEKFDGRMYRLFNTGHREEARFFQELRGIGCECHGDEGEQLAVTAVGGHLSGHLDGVALGIPEAPKTWHLCEFKTHSHKSFEKVKADGVAKSKSMHFAQMQVYMGLGKLTRGLYLAADKDTDELYSERIEFDSAKFKAIMARAERIIKANEVDKCTTRPDDFRCKFCGAYEACWGNAIVPQIMVTCRTCCHATPEIDKGETWARWSCGKHKRDLTEKEQVKACDDYLVLPALVNADVESSTEDSITYKTTEGVEFTIGKGGWGIKELRGLPRMLATADKVKAAFEANVCGFEVPELNLIDRYDPKDSRLVWEGKPGGVKQDGKITGVFKDEKHIATEYDGKFLYVEYVGCDYAAIWEGVE